MRIRSLKHKQLIALVLVALTPLFALTASMWMQAQNSKEQAVQTYQGYADTIAIALEKELDRQKERLEEMCEKNISQVLSPGGGQLPPMAEGGSAHCEGSGKAARP